MSSTLITTDTTHTRQQRLGIAAVLVSAACFGCLAIFARLTYASGANLWGALPVRMLVAGIVLGAVVVALRLPLPQRKAIIGLTLMGGVGYVLQSVCYFAALNYAPAGVVALLLYLFPAFVLLVSVLFLGEHFTRAKLIALVLALVGCALTIMGAQGAGASATVQPVQMLGVVLGVAAAVVYTAYILVGSRLGQGVHPVVSTAIVCLSSGVVFVLIGLIRHAAGLPVAFAQDLNGWLANIGMALISSVAAILLFFYGLGKIGATNASIYSTFEPVVTVVLAALVLAEPVSVLQAVGGVLVIAAAINLARAGQSG